MSVTRMCELAGVSHAGYYRDLQDKVPQEEEMEVRSAIQEIFLEHHGRYGRRRITAELRRRGMQVNHKRVGRLLRADNLLAIQSRGFVVTTESDHECEIFLNVAACMRLTGINQLWVADLTYIRLRDEFVYLAVVLDCFSRCVVGWSLGVTLTARLTITALQQAIAARNPAPGLVHHSDRGVQYAAADYVELLRQHGILPSMSRPANPYDNAVCERFMKTLKQEEIYGRQYRDQADLDAHVEEFIDKYYNGQRLHSALGYRTPAEFEQSISISGHQGGPVVRLSFQRHPEIYPSDQGAST
jgi:putative transposase